MAILNFDRGRGSLPGAFFLLAILLAGCDDEKEISVPDLRPIAVRIEGPTQVTSPAQVQFRALQTWSDGSSRDVTAGAQWTSTNPSVLSISAGSATALAGGEVGLRVQFDGLSSQTITVRVVPATPEWNGTYTLTVGGGACSGSVPLPSELRQRTYAAVIQQNGLTLNVTVRNAGFFSGQILNPEVRFFLFGPQGFSRPARKAAVTEGLQDRVRPAISRDETRVRFAGYTTRFAYSFPPEPLSEFFPDGSRLAITGNASTTMSPSGFAGTLNGSFALYAPGNTVVGVCTSTSHGFALVRQ